MRIRQGKSEDLARLIEIECLGTEQYYRVGFSQEEFLPRTEEDLRFLLTHTHLDVAVDDENLAVGFISYYSVGPYLHLEEHVVHKEWQHRGFGCNLLEQYLKAGAAEDYKYYSLFAFREAKWAWDLYFKHGFRPLELWKLEMLEEDAFKRILTSEKKQKYSYSRQLMVLERE